jgi:hypothetical protein
MKKFSKFAAIGGLIAVLAVPKLESQFSNMLNSRNNTENVEIEAKRHIAFKKVYNLGEHRKSALKYTRVDYPTENELRAVAKMIYGECYLWNDKIGGEHNGVIWADMVQVAMVAFNRMSVNKNGEKYFKYRDLTHTVSAPMQFTGYNAENECLSEILAFVRYVGRVWAENGRQKFNDVFFFRAGEYDGSKRFNNKFWEGVNIDPKQDESIPEGSYNAEVHNLLNGYRSYQNKMMIADQDETARPTLAALN